MILKRMYFDEKGRTVTSWTEGIVSASMYYSDDWKSYALSVAYRDEKCPANEPSPIVLHEGEGVYLCNDSGKTVEVLSRLQKPTNV